MCAELDAEVILEKGKISGVYCVGKSGENQISMGALIKKYKFLPLTLIYAAGIVWISTRPGVAGGHPSWKRRLFMDSRHIPAYLGLAVLVMFAMADIFPQKVRAQYKKYAAVVFVAAVSFGAFNEFLQVSVPGRMASLNDMVMNMIGAGIGLWVVLMLQKNRKLS